MKTEQKTEQMEFPFAGDLKPTPGVVTAPCPVKLSTSPNGLQHREYLLDLSPQIKVVAASSVPDNCTPRALYVKVSPVLKADDEQRVRDFIGQVLAVEKKLSPGGCAVAYDRNLANLVK